MNFLWIWLNKKPYRFTALNMCLLTILLSLVGSTTIFVLVGSLSITISCAYCIKHATLLTIKSWKEAHPYELALIWAPCCIAVALSIAGIYLTTQNAVGSTLYLVGCVMFGFEVAVLAILGANLRDSEMSIKKYLEVK